MVMTKLTVFTSQAQWLLLQILAHSTHLDTSHSKHIGTSETDSRCSRDADQEEDACLTHARSWDQTSALETNVTESTAADQ